MKFKDLSWKPKRTLVILAHPDDEAFGPGGTIASLATYGEVELISVTDGNDPRRVTELDQSVKILGINKIWRLHFTDGELGNNLYHKIADKFEKIFYKVRPNLILTYELRGVSGHIDHVIVSMIATFVFEKTRVAKELWYFCLDQRQRKAEGDDYFIYFPPGYKKSDIDLTIEVDSVWKTKTKAMYCHQTQIKDVESILSRYKELPKIENFQIKKRK